MDMHHPLRLLTLNVPSHSPYLFRPPRRIILQHLMRPTSQVHRRQPLRIRLQNIHQRILPLTIIEKYPNHHIQITRRHHWIGSGVGLHRPALRVHRRPGREADNGGGQRVASVAQLERDGDGEVAAGRVAHGCDARGLEALLAKPVVRGHAVVEHRGPAVLGRHTVVDAQRPAACRFGDVSGHFAVRGRVVGDEAAAVGEEDHVGLRGVQWLDPERRNGVRAGV